MAPPIKYLISPGQRFGRWTVLDASSRAAVLCRCDCGTERAVAADDLGRAATRSCGCLRDEKSRERRLTHGLGYEDYRYRLWSHMMGRCYRQSHRNFAQYGGRGIGVCSAWRDPGVFAREIVRLLGERPDGYTLDRIDNDGHYEPGNVRWATRREQANNRRTNALLTVGGETATIAEWSRRTGLPAGTIWYRLKRYGWSAEEAVNTHP